MIANVTRHTMEYILCSIRHQTLLRTFSHLIQSVALPISLCVAGTQNHCYTIPAGSFYRQLQQCSKPICVVICLRQYVTDWDSTARDSVMRALIYNSIPQTAFWSNHFLGWSFVKIGSNRKTVEHVCHLATYRSGCLGRHIDCLQLYQMRCTVLDSMHT